MLLVFLYCSQQILAKLVGKNPRQVVFKCVKVIGVLAVNPLDPILSLEPIIPLIISCC